MTTAEILALFVAHDDVREWIMHPFRQDGRLWATNGHTLVSLPDDAGIHADDFVVPILPGIRTTFEACSQFAAYTAALPPADACSRCGGTGQAAQDNEDDDICCECDGTGIYPHQPILVHGQKLARRYLAIALTLPGVEFCTAPHITSGPMAYFRFTGGWGVIMALRY